MNAVYVVLGFVLLVTGVQLPWLFVAGMGFLLGNFIGATQSIGMRGIALTLFSAGLGIVLGLLVIYIKRILYVLAGFVAGAYTIAYMPGALGWNTDWISTPVIVIAGLVAALIVFFSQSLALILVSSLVGSTLVIQYARFPNISEVFLFTIFALFGIIAQWVLMQYNRPETT